MRTPIAREHQKAVSIVTLCVLLTVALVLIWRMMAPYLDAIFVAAALGISGFPIYAWLERRWHRPAFASAVATAIIIALIAGPLLFLVVTVAREAGSLYHTLETSSRSQGGWTVWFSKLIEGPIKWLAQSIGMQAPDLKLALMNRVQDMGNAQLARVGSLFGNVTSTLTEATIMFFTLYFFFQGAVRLRVLAVSWIPLPMGRVEELLDVVAETIRANVYGTLAVAAAQGAFTGIGFAIVGLPTAWLWGVVAAFCSLVPIVGPALVWVPAAASLVFSGAWIRALILVVWSIVIVAGLGDQLLRPLLLRGRMTMNTLLIVFSILGGLEYFGLVGLIAGPVVFSVAASLFRILGEMLRQNSAPADEVEPVSS